MPLDEMAPNKLAVTETVPSPATTGAASSWVPTVNLGKGRTTKGRARSGAAGAGGGPSMKNWMYEPGVAMLPAPGEVSPWKDLMKLSTSSSSGSVYLA